MKGPSLPYELRVLRVFKCGACGRIAHMPGRVTSHLCYCSDPPKFMQPQERPVTKSPDVSAFLSPADPEDLVEDVETAEEPYVPYIPKLPPRPPQFPSRRKLSDEIDKFVPPEFGDGLENSPQGTSGTNQSSFDGGPPTQNTSTESNGGRGRSERGGRGRDRSDRRPDGPTRNEHSNRNAPGNRNQSGPSRPNHTPGVTAGNDSTSRDHGTLSETGSQPDNATDQGRRIRRRGRDRSAPRDDGQPKSTDDALVIDPLEKTDTDDFGSGVESTARPNTQTPSTGSRDETVSMNPSTDEESDDNSDEEESDQAASGDLSAPRRRRNRRRGRRRGRGGPGSASGDGNGPTPNESV